jgi:hypothetical protein
MAGSLFNLLGTEHNWNVKSTPNTGLDAREVDASGGQVPRWKQWH